MAYDYKRYFGEITTLHDLTTRPDERRWRLAAPPKDAERHAIVLYLGCNVLRTSHLVQTVTAIFDRLGLDYVAVGGPAYCCGIQQHNHNDAAASERVSHHTIELFQRYQPEEIVMWCPSCIYFYDEIRHYEFPFRVRHTTEFLVSQLPRVAFTRPANAGVALHAHSLGEARQREAAAARTLLQTVPGLRYVHVEPDPRFSRSCTPAVQQQLGPGGWDAAVREEMGRARAGGAGTLATIYHGCQRQMCSLEGDGMLIEHYLTVFGRALGIEFEDKFKKYRQWQDPERVLADMTPCQMANGVDVGRARELVTAMFAPGAPASTQSLPS
ncbi:MAG: (Fe-S)-binding protein [Candidatus Rokubacteria bacterium]|nr:(Fe-S)-binding protein [Candidatus Rokubacteria bacterium]MBI3826306.1 (Fe-S)-binding protein [Candidatus Rokubacteria bacterium]